MEVDIDTNLIAIRNIDGGRRFKCSYNQKTVYVLLRDSFDVTNVDTYNCNGLYTNGFDDRWENRTTWAENSWKFRYVYGAYISFSWQNKTLQPNDSIEFVYAFGTGRYNNESALTIAPPIDPYFAPSSVINANISVDQFDGLSQICIFRYVNEIDQTKQVLLANYTDSLNTKYFNDIINLPNVSGYHRIIYILTQNETEVAQESFDVLINEVPRIRTNVELKRQFRVGEEVSFYLDVYDDTFVILYGETESAFLFSKVVFCNGKINRTHVVFKIPKDSGKLDQIITIYATDQFDSTSNVYQFLYNVVEYKSPELEIRSKLRTYYKEKEVINVYGRVRDMDGTGDVNIYSSFNNTNITSYGIQRIKDTNWIDVTFSVQVMSSHNTVNILRLYCINTKQRISNTFVHTFSIVPDNSTICDCVVIQSCVCYRKGRFMHGLIAFSNI